MALSEQFAFFINSGYFTDDYSWTEMDFLCTSSLSGQKFRIQRLKPSGYRIYLKVQGDSGERWQMRAEVTDRESVLGFVTTCEDDWLKQKAKEEKKKVLPK